MPPYVPQVPAWARIRTLQSLSSFGTWPILGTFLVFCAFALIDILVETPYPLGLALLAGAVALVLTILHLTRRSGIQERLDALSSSFIKRHVAIAVISIDPPIVPATAAFILLVDRWSRSCIDGIETYHLVQQGTLNHGFLVPSTIRFRPDGVAEIDISRSDLSPVTVRINLAKGPTRIVLREEPSAGDNPYLDCVRRLIDAASLQSIGEIRKMRITIAQALHPDTGRRSDLPARTEALAFANAVLDQRLKDIHL